MMKSYHSIGRLGRPGRLLIFLFALCAFLAHGLTGPGAGNATVLVGSEFSAPTASVKSGSASPMTAITGTFAVGAGYNRLLVVVAQWEAAATADTSSFTSGTWGGQNLVSLYNTFSSGVSRNRQWVGYLTESAIASAVGTTLNLNIATGANPTEYQVKAAWYSGVSTTTPINHFVNSNNEAPGATTHNFGGTALNVIRGGIAYYFETSNGGVTYTPPAGWTEHYDGNAPAANFARTAASAPISTTTTTNPTVTQSAATRYTIGALSLNPAPPTVTSTSPNNMTQGTGPTTVSIFGTNFQTGATVTFSGTGISLGAVSVVSSTQIDIPVTVAAGATTGARNVTVTNTDALAGIGTGVFTVNAAATNGTLAFTGATFSVAETGGSVNLTVSRTGGSTGAVSVECAYSGTGTATSGTDFTFSSPATLNWADADATNKNCTITINDESVWEGNETANFQLQNATGGATIGAQSTTQLTITDNETQPSIQFQTTTSNGDEAVTPASFTVVLSGASASAVTVSYTTSNGTATAPADYTAKTSSLVIPALSTNGTITVVIQEDAIVESPDEYFRITLSAPILATLGTNTIHTYTINDNDGGPSDTLSVALPTALATPPKTDTAAYVVMERFQVTTGPTGTSAATLNSITVSDGTGTAATIASVRIFLSTSSSTTIPTNAVLIGKVSNWSTAAPAVIPLNLGTAADRTVTNGTPKYVYVVYDMFDGTAGATTQASVTAIGVSAPDNVNSTGLPFTSNSISLTAGIKATVVSCSDCHGNPPVDGTRSAATGSFLGSHTMHTATPANLGLACTICHVDNGTDTSHRNADIDMLANFTTFGGSYSKGTISGSLRSFPQVTNPSFVACNGVYCHSTVQGVGGSGAGADRPQNWGAAGPLGCGVCHVNMKTDAGAPGSHRAHAQSGNIPCGSCHTGYTDTTVTMSSHANRTIDVNSGLSYTNTGVPGNGYGGCTNATGCHVSAYNASTVNTPQWGVTAGCNACHIGQGAFASYGSPTWGSHPKHAGSQGYDCGLCHTGSQKDVSGGAQHADGDIDVTNGYQPNVPKHAPGSGYYRCTNASCHASPYGPQTSITPTWGVGGAGCASCHSGQGAFASYGSPTWGSHAKHVGSQGYACNQCHPSAVKDVSGGVEHGDGNIDVYISTPLDIQYGAIPDIPKHNPGSGYARCNNASCHSSPYGSATSPTPTWGVGGAGCSSCHNGGGAFASYGSPTYGRHAKHLSSYAFVCGDCHTGAVKDVSGGAQHGDGNIDVALNYQPDVAKHSAGTYTASPVCGNFYCHSKGVSVASSLVPTFTVGTTWAGTTACNSCHGNEAGSPILGLPFYLSSKHTPSTVSVVTGWTNTQSVFSTYNFSNVLREDNRYITYTGTTSQPLVVTNFTFSTSEVPDGSDITGYSVIIKGTSTAVGTLSARLTDNATATPTAAAGSAKTFSLPTTTTEVVVNTAVNDTWGATLTPAQVRSANFGVVISDSDATNSNINIDIVKVVVHTSRTKMNSHASHTVWNGNATQCSMCHYNVTTTSTSITNTSLHVNQAYDLAQGPSVTINYTYNATGGTCSTASCHSSAVPAKWGVSDLDCVGCHLVLQTAPTASLRSAGTVTRRRAVSSEFQQASSHKRSAQGLVTKFDCVVCHMEGTPVSGTTSTHHANGYLDLRDPDTGGQIGVATWGGTGAGSYTSAGTASFVRFSRNLNSDALETGARSAMINQCLRCHDANGASSTLARVPGAPNAWKPFNTTVTANGTSQGVLDVNTQFATTQRSYHPILGKQNNGYAGGTRMVSPWNLVTKSATTTVWGPLLTCWDCHADNSATGTLTATSVHGGGINGTDAVPLRGNVYGAGGTTSNVNLCYVCHTGYATGAASHGAGSAFSTTANNGMSNYMPTRCHICHSSANSDTRPARPVPAENAHGFSTRAGGTAFANTNNGYAFIRSEGYYGSTYVQNPRQVGGVNYTQQCTGYGGGGGTPACSRNSMTSYGPGGVY